MAILLLNPWSGKLWTTITSKHISLVDSCHILQSTNIILINFSSQLSFLFYYISLFFQFSGTLKIFINCEQ